MLRWLIYFCCLICLFCFVLSWDKMVKIILINDATVSPTGRQSYSSPPPRPTLPSLPQLEARVKFLSRTRIYLTEESCKIHWGHPWDKIKLLLFMCGKLFPRYKHTVQRWLTHYGEDKSYLSSLRESTPISLDYNPAPKFLHLEDLQILVG